MATTRHSQEWIYTEIAEDAEGTEKRRLIEKSSSQLSSDRKRLNEVSHQVIGSAIAVHRELGPGLLESAYEACLALELTEQGLRFERQKPMAVVYKGLVVDCGYRLDLLVEGAVVIEIKAVDEILPVHRAQLLSYLKLSSYPLGLLINFHAKVLVEDIVRYVNSTFPL